MESKPIIKKWTTPQAERDNNFNDYDGTIAHLSKRVDLEYHSLKLAVNDQELIKSMKETIE